MTDGATEKDRAAFDAKLEEGSDEVRNTDRERRRIFARLGEVG